MKKTKKTKKTSAKTRVISKGKNLVIVESPAKIKTISKILGPGYLVRSSFGHVRDLPKSTFGLDMEHDFTPHYIVIRKQTKAVNELKKLAAGVNKLFLATDPDREGEAIAWHLAQILNVPAERVWRVSFDEITATAVRNAFENPHKIDQSLVNAQQARRFLDRIMGYKLSPLLWKKITKGLSAGRVQSVALRLVVEREKAILNFNPCEHWKITAELTPNPINGHNSNECAGKFMTLLTKLNDVNVGNPLDNDIWLGAETEARKLVDYLEKSQWAVANITARESSHNPPPPFITSTMQQTASIKLNYSPKKTMLIAQQLYEGIDLPDGPSGLITYMRTDSVRVSEEAIRECRSFIATHYGADLVNEETRRYRPSKQSQQAHEAIRPSYITKTPDSLRSYLTSDQYKLYNIIWKRFMATQMKPAIWRSKAVEIAAQQVNAPELELEILSNQKKNRVLATRILAALTPDAKDNQEAIEQVIAILNKSREDEASAKKILELAGKNPEDKPALVKVISLINEPVDNNLINEKMNVRRCVFGATESRLVFKGFLTLYQPTEELLPDIKEQNTFALNKLTPSQSFTEPPPRYTEASLVKTLEKYGIGRPSTYAPIISTIEDRGYVNKNGRQLSPTDLGVLVNDKLLPFFEDIINTQFTARIEEELDLIEESQKNWVDTLKEFYGPFIHDLQKAETEMVSEKNKQVEGPCPKCGKPIVERWSRFGKFLSCSAYPECKYTMSLKPKVAPMDTGLVCEKCGKPMVVKTNYRRSRFIACSGYPDCKNAKPLPKEVAERLAPAKPSVEEKTEENESESSAER